jgi:Kef-type K+ transport system membrane component KefB
MNRKNIFYAVVIIAFALFAWFIFFKGGSLTSPKASGHVITTSGHAHSNSREVLDSVSIVKAHFKQNLQHPLSLLLLQILVIVAVSRLFGLLFNLIKQPTVVGEIVAGIVLGPSLLGFLLPDVYAFLFPVSSLQSLQFLSQIGLAFFMFIVGMELEVQSLKKKAQEALIISHSSILFPFFLGLLLSYFIYEDFAQPGTDFMSFGLFMGTAMSITAFPVLARILKERNMIKSPLGNLVITCAAADDVTAWCILAIVIAIVKAGNIIAAMITIVLAIVLVVVLLFVIRIWLKKLNTITEKYQKDRAFVSVAFLVLLISAYLAEVIGIHALFGSFVAGLIMPQNSAIKEKITEKLEDVSMLILLPIFFAYVGIKTQITLLNDSSLWSIAAVIISVAIAGKVIGSTVAAKVVGQSWKDSLSIGVLMNTRGLMELIVLNIGLDLGILSPEIFAIMVLMALVTTFMTGPIMDLIDYVSRKR